MSWVLLFHVLVAPALVHAQSSGAAGPSHYCATYNSDSQPEDCSFTSLQMCQQSINGLGGWCGPQSQAPVMPPPPLFKFPAQFDSGQAWGTPLAFPPASAPPPPIGQTGPLQLPDAN